jgi:transcriptional regulator with XRE-family HTH domain
LSESPIVLQARLADHQLRRALLERLHEIRRGKKISIQELGRRTGLAPRTFYDGFSGHQPLSYTSLAVLAQVLGHRLVIGLEAPKSAEVVGCAVTEADLALIDEEAA